jgi:hypothetical protein
MRRSVRKAWENDKNDVMSINRAVTESISALQSMIEKLEKIEMQLMDEPDFVDELEFLADGLDHLNPALDDLKNMQISLRT